MSGYLVIDESGHRWPDSQWQGTKAEQEADGLTGALRTADVEGDGSEHGDEAAVKDAHDEAEDHERLVLVVAEGRCGHEQHRAQPD